MAIRQEASCSYAVDQVLREFYQYASFVERVSFVSGRNALIGSTSHVARLASSIKLRACFPCMLLFHIFF